MKLQKPKNKKKGERERGRREKEGERERGSKLEKSVPSRPL